MMHQTGNVTVTYVNTTSSLKKIVHIWTRMENKSKRDSKNIISFFFVGCSVHISDASCSLRWPCLVNSIWEEEASSTTSYFFYTVTYERDKELTKKSSFIIRIKDIFKLWCHVSFLQLTYLMQYANCFFNHYSRLIPWP